MFDRFKDRIPLAPVGMLCLVIGLVLPMVLQPGKGVALNLLHFVSGLFIGISLSVNLMAVWKASRKRRSDSL